MNIKSLYVYLFAIISSLLTFLFFYVTKNIVTEDKIVKENIDIYDVAKKEAVKLGFTDCLVPKGNSKNKNFDNIKYRINFIHTLLQNKELNPIIDDNCNTENVENINGEEDIRNAMPKKYIDFNKVGIILSIKISSLLYKFCPTEKVIL